LKGKKLAEMSDLEIDSKIKELRTSMKITIVFAIIGIAAWLVKDLFFFTAVSAQPLVIILALFIIAIIFLIELVEVRIERRIREAISKIQV